MRRFVQKGMIQILGNGSPSSGGGTGGGNGGDGEEWIGDGKTHLWIKIAAEGRMDVPLHFTQTVANGVSIDWGDGSAPETLSGTGTRSVTHKYASIGEYCITLDVADGCTIGLGHGLSDYVVIGGSKYPKTYANMLQKVEIGNGVTSIGSNAFYNCHSLASVVIPEGVTSIGSNAFYNCYSLASVVIPEGVTSIGNSAFYNCYSLASVVIPEGVTSIGSNVFSGCTGMKFYDFTKYTSVPTLSNANVFNYIPSDCEIRVPAALYDEWIAATNWSTYADKIVAV